MNVAIDLHDKTGCGAIEVDDEAVNSVLTPPTRTIQLTIPQYGPEKLLSGCRLLS